MLEAKSIKFNEIDAGANTPAWARVVIEDHIHVTAMKEVRPFPMAFFFFTEPLR